MLERCGRNFRLFLRALEGDACAFCAVTSALELDQVAQIQGGFAKHDPAALCGRHFRLVLHAVDDPTKRTRISQQVVSADFQGGRAITNRACLICTPVRTVLTALARSVRSLDGKMRFEKALQRAPLFCRLHASDVLAIGEAPMFARVQYDKLKQLYDELAQALLRNGENLEQLIERAMVYTDAAPPKRAEAVSLNLPVSAPDSGAEIAEFDRWDSQQVLQHLSDVESEVASLRYRNATLAEENRRLKLARVAVDATMRDLQREHDKLRGL